MPRVIEIGDLLHVNKQFPFNSSEFAFHGALLFERLEAV
jgi:hypothetical protein